MSDALAALAPRSVWDFFASIAAIPRPSKHEEKIAAWVRSVAADKGFEVRSDAIGNLVVVVPATPGHEAAPIVVLQSHLDMVCEKNKGVEHDFMNDPIRPRIDGEWVYASGTTLGADNGLGVAAALAAATDPGVTHGPLELLFTLDEETGLTGAQQLDASMLQGRILLNLDSEEDGILFVGCAGGADMHLFLEMAKQPAGAGRSAYRVEVSGLKGGHSGLNILENRGNALKLLTRLISAAVDVGLDPELASLHGGSMHNAIPREAEARVYLDSAHEAAFAELATRSLEQLRSEYTGVDEDLSIRVSPTDEAADVWSDADRDRLLHLLSVLPHGVLTMSREIAGLVETSSNLAAVSEQNGRIRIVTSSRSSVASALSGVLKSIRSAGRLAGAAIETHDGYPGWKPNMDSAVLQVVRGVYREIWGSDPEVTAIHAGLECGLLGERVPGIDMISFGPQIEGAHSPDERVHIESVERFWRALGGTLRTLATAAPDPRAS